MRSKTHSALLCSPDDRSIERHLISIRDTRTFTLLARGPKLGESDDTQPRKVQVFLKPLFRVWANVRQPPPRQTARHESGLQGFKDFFENIVVHLPSTPRRVNCKDDLFEPSRKFFIEQDRLHLFGHIAWRTTIRAASHRT